MRWRGLSDSRVVLVLLCVMYFILFVDRVSISTVAPLIKTDLKLSNTELGLAFSAFAFPYALLQLFGSWIGDKFGPRLTLTVCCAIVGVSTVLTGAAVDTSAAPASGAVIVLHFSDGGGWTTQILLVNPGSTALTGSVEFRDDNGALTTVAIGGQSNNTFSYAVPPRSSQKLATNGLVQRPRAGLSASFREMEERHRYRSSSFRISLDEQLR